MTDSYLNPNAKASGSSPILAPLEVVKQWPKANYDDPVTRPKVVVPLVSFLGVIMVGIVGARMWARFVIQKNAKLDDWFMLAAMIPAIGLGIVIVLAIEVYSFDRHIWDVEPSLYTVQRQFIFGVYLLYLITSGLIKVSILLFYRRLDTRCVSSAFRLATHLNILAIAIFVVAFTLVLFTGCIPLAAFWNQFDIELQRAGYRYHCWYNEQADIVAASIVSALQDAVTALLPTLLYWNLHFPRRQKIALTAIFASGYLVVIVCIVRVYFTFRIFDNPMYDGSWTTWPALLLLVLELYLGASVASVPALKVFARHYFGSGGSGSGSGNQGSRSGTDSSLRYAWFRKPKETPSQTVALSSALSRNCDGDEEGDLALIEIEKSETRDAGSVV